MYENEKKPKKGKKRISKKTKKEGYVKKNFNLKKLIKEEGLDEPSKFINFVNCKSKPSLYPKKKFCSICGNFAKYHCPRCGEPYCSLKCHKTHKEVLCLKFDS